MKNISVEMSAMDELLSVRNSIKKMECEAQTAFVQENELRVAELEHRKRNLEQSLTAEELEEVRISQFRSNKMVQQIYRKSEEGVLITSSDWENLTEVIRTITPKALAFLDEHRPRMIEEDYKMCLLIIVGMAPKHIVRLLCCTPQKVSMQRKRYLKEFFSKDGKPSAFDTLLRTM